MFDLTSTQMLVLAAAAAIVLVPRLGDIVGYAKGLLPDGSISGDDELLHSQIDAFQLLSPKLGDKLAVQVWAKIQEHVEDSSDEAN